MKKKHSGGWQYELCVLQVCGCPAHLAAFSLCLLFHSGLCLCLDCGWHWVPVSMHRMWMCIHTEWCVCISDSLYWYIITSGCPRMHVPCLCVTFPSRFTNCYEWAKICIWSQSHINSRKLWENHQRERKMQLRNTDSLKKIRARGKGRTREREVRQRKKRRDRPGGERRCRVRASRRHVLFISPCKQREKSDIINRKLQIVNRRL